MSGMSTNALLPSGTPLEGGALAPPEPPNPLLSLGPGLQEALLLMDYAINQNNYLPQLLLYRWGAACMLQTWNDKRTHWHCVGHAPRTHLRCCAHFTRVCCPQYLIMCTLTARRTLMLTCRIGQRQLAQHTVQYDNQRPINPPLNSPSPPPHAPCPRRDIQPLPGMRSSAMSALHRQMSGLDDGDSDAMSHAGGRDRPLSAVPSDGGRSHGAESIARSQHAGAGARGGAHQGGAVGVMNLSRQPSERSVALTRALSVRESHAGQVPADARSARHSHGGGGAGIGGYAASVAESNWPEELLQVGAGPGRAGATVVGSGAKAPRVVVLGSGLWMGQARPYAAWTAVLVRCHTSGVA